MGRWLRRYADDPQLCTSLSAGTWPPALCEHERDGAGTLLALQQQTNRCCGVVVVVVVVAVVVVGVSKPGLIYLHFKARPCFLFLIQGTRQRVEIKSHLAFVFRRARRENRARLELGNLKRAL